MATISLCMIVKNEENNLARCLDSARDLVDEIVIVDTGSTDNTRALALKYTDKVYDFQWCDDFAAARNFAFGHGTMDYLMWLDADDVLEPPDRETFIALKRELAHTTDVVMMRYHTAFDAQDKPAFTYYRERILRRGAGFHWAGAVHEAITPAGNIVWWEAAVSHRKQGAGDPDRNLRIYESLLAAGKSFSPREQFYYARELTYHSRYADAVEWFERFLDGGQGWIENVLQACRDLAACYEQLGRHEAGFHALTRALRYAPPNPELCCELGRFFFTRQNWSAAAYWYECARNCPQLNPGGGFVEPDCRDYLPLIQLCVCYYQLGNTARAIECNELAGKLKPESAAYQFNKTFFAQMP